MRSSILFAMLSSIAGIQACVIMHAQVHTEIALGTSISMQVWDNDVEVCHGNAAGNSHAEGSEVRRLDCGNGAWVEMSSQAANWRYHSKDGYEFAPAPGTGEKIGPKCTRPAPGEGVPSFKICNTFYRAEDGFACDKFPHHDNCQLDFCG